MRRPLFTAVLLSALAAPAFATDVSFTLVAQEFTAGVPWLTTGIPVPRSSHVVTR